ncbi:MAG: radical SAM protein [Thermodesulfovibrionales bacterium]
MQACYTIYVLSQRIRERIDFLLSKEKGTIYKEPGGRINICLIYPNTYHLGMSNLGFQGIYTLLNSRHDVVCERSFLPDEEDIEEFVRTGSEIVSMESKRPLNRFDIVAFSVSFENDYPNIPIILKLSKIPLFASERKGENYPLLIMGGICAFFNPEPIAEIFDICFIGEAEEMLEEFLDLYKGSVNREEVLRGCLRIEGLYVPKFYEVEYGNGSILKRRHLKNAPEMIKKRFVKDLNKYPLKPSIITPETEFSQMYLIEAMRGCPWSCRFCVTGYVYKPVRKKDKDRVIDEIRTVSDTDRFGLIGPSLSDHPDIGDVLRLEGVEFSITSLRASRRSADIVRLLKGSKSVSIAPEAGTERLRRVIDKRITEEDIIETSRLILSEGIENLRLYFMIGLPTESEEDIDGIVTLVKKIRDTSPRGNIVLTVSTFVPKPFTPFQWHPMEIPEIVKARLKIIKKGLQHLRGVKVFHDVAKYAYMQGLFSRGDRRIAQVLKVMSNGRDWKKACLEVGIDIDYYIFRKRDFEEILPWDFIDCGIPKERLWREYQMALMR